MIIKCDLYGVNLVFNYFYVEMLLLCNFTNVFDENYEISNSNGTLSLLEIEGHDPWINLKLIIKV